MDTHPLWSFRKSNPEVNAFMQAMNITGDYAGLEALYIHRLVDILEKLQEKKSLLVWQEVFDNNVPLEKDAIVHVWIDGNWREEMLKVNFYKRSFDRSLQRNNEANFIVISFSHYFTHHYQI
jgi:pectate lyase